MRQAVGRTRPRPAVLPRVRPDAQRAQKSTQRHFRLRIGRARLPFWSVLALILVAAAITRFAGLGWGANHYLHPDERYMTMVTIAVQWPDSVGTWFDSALSPLNPFNVGQTSYLYGTLPLFLAKLIGTISGDIVYGDAHMPGRFLSAIADLGSVALVAFIGRRLFRPEVGLLAALLLAFTPLHIQNAHYYTTDSVSAFFAVASFAAVLCAWPRRSWRWFVIAGLCAGLAAASKPNLIITVGFLAVPVLETVRRHGWPALLPPWRRFPVDRRAAVRFPVLAAAALGALAAFLAFRVAQPYAFAGPNIWDLRLDPRWTDTLDYWRQVQSGVIDVPPGIQWADRTPMVFILDNLVRWGMGPALGITALVAVALFSLSTVRARRWPSWWTLALLAWVLFHLLFYGTALVKTQRYLLPAYPFLVLLAAALLQSLPDVVARERWHAGDRAEALRQRLPDLRSRFPWRPPAPAAGWLGPRRIVTALVVAGTIISGSALVTVFVTTHSRVTASEWIYENIPAGSAITSEYWDDGLPITLPDQPSGSYTSVQTAPYDVDDEAKLTRLVGQLQQADYIILSSDRLIGSVPRMPDRYPMATAYYDALVSGELGFDLVAEFTSPPRLFGIEFDDTGAEEALTVYDHPRVRIFQKSDRYSHHDVWYLLDAALGDGGAQRRVIDTPESQMLLAESDRALYADAGTWTAMFDTGLARGVLPVVVWYLVLQVLAVPGVLLAWRAFPGLPDRGYAMAKTLGLVGVCWIAWMLASFRLVQFGRGTVFLSFLLALLFAVVVVWPRRAMLDDLRARWRWVVTVESLFLGVFVAVTWLRALNPDLWNAGRGGEKPMELAMFNAILRSPYFPPYDAWFAGGTLHYYYLGYVPWAAITRVTGIVPDVAFNLALPSVIALFAVSVWSAAAALLHHIRVDTPSASDPGAPSAGPRVWTIALLALAAPVAVGLLGNLDFARRIGRGELGYPLPPTWLDPFGDLGLILWGAVRAISTRVDLTASAYWDPTRVIPGTVNEMPWFSTLFGDLHAHVLALPIVAAVIVVAIAVATGVGAPETTDRARLLDTLGGWRVAGSAGVVGGFLSGSLVAINTWDLPASVAILAAGAGIAAMSRSERGPWPRLRDSVLFVAVVVVSGRLLFWPFISQFGALPTEAHPAVEFTRLSDYLTIHGVMLTALGGYFALESWRVGVMLWHAGQWWGRVCVLALGVALPLGYGIAFATGDTVHFLVMALATVAFCLSSRRDLPGHLTIYAMTGLALGLGLVPELIRLQSDIGRMNLVFKLYLHAWILLAIAAVPAVVHVVGTLLRAQTRSEPRSHANSQASVRAPGIGLGMVAGRVWLVFLWVFVLAAASYPALVTGPRLQDRFSQLGPTLNGYAFMDDALVMDGPDGGEPTAFTLAGDRDAIDWLRAHVRGTPVIVEAQLSAYRWGARVSVTTGLPTVLGWTYHQIQQRPGYGSSIDQRLADVQTIYGGGSYAQIAPLLERYDVALIYVGELEHAVYGPDVRTTFDRAVESGDLNVVYRTSSVSVYQVAGRDVLLPGTDPPSEDDLAATPIVVATTEPATELAPESPAIPLPATVDSVDAVEDADVVEVVEDPALNAAAEEPAQPPSEPEVAVPDDLSLRVSTVRVAVLIAGLSIPVDPDDEVLEEASPEPLPEEAPIDVQDEDAPVEDLENETLPGDG